MFEWYVLSLFLYFPEDKTEYIPAAISFVIFFFIAVLTMRWIIRVSKREAEKAKQLEEEILGEKKDQNNS
ncbi:hypothetical protein SM124_09945 [Bacillus sp. 31A1R]|uniref:Uncharacterized protein n=1 Tax=Robertmurraya mangrovi TaxID=3098077 RepID=A0ABU5IY22_9BACI|nr:hypothetical protein [Bacillus sp. 31A1R]MDZ5472068.1 hypothetical protein [Bacillus sp. 31A1R]